jgi:hypothetical protein
MTQFLVAVAVSIESRLREPSSQIPSATFALARKDAELSTTH